MKVRDFNNNIYTWNPTGYEVTNDETRPRSSLHIQCRTILKQLFPTERILEEVPIPKLRLYFDFYLPSHKLAIECHGQQHYEFVPHFHGTKWNWAMAKQNDQKKRDWCILNNITLIELPYTENIDEWTKRICNK